MALSVPRRFAVPLGSLLACGWISIAAAPVSVSAAGGNGQSYCSQATGPQSGPKPFPAGQYGSFSNPGDVVRSLVGILWGPGVSPPDREPGLFTRTICSGSGQ